MYMIMKQMLFWIKAPEPQIPSWAKAEQMEISTPQSALWIWR